MGTASKLFDLFLEFRRYEITDGAGQSVAVMLRALRYDEQQRIVDQLGDIRREARARHDTDELRVSLAKELAPLARDRLIDTLILFERPVAEANADLAPAVPKPLAADQVPDSATPTPEAPARDQVPDSATPTPEGEVASKAEAAAVVKWEKERRKQLGEIEDAAILRAMVVDRQIELAVQSELTQRLASLQLAAMVVDPDTREPLLSLAPEADNYIGKLMPATRGRFIELWREFQQDVNDQQLRKAARGGPFSPSGGSPKPPADTPGGTTATPSRSRRTSSVSTPGAAG